MLWFRLAALWGCTVREAQQRCSPSEFLEWKGYYLLEPWGEWRADLRSGIVACVVANAHARKGNSYRPSDFMPKFGLEERRGQTEDEQRAAFSAFKSACGAVSSGNEKNG